MTKALLIVAGGSGSRFKQSIPKQFTKINDKTVLEHVIERSLKEVDIMMISVHQNFLSLTESIVEKYQNIHICIGGQNRQTSVLNGLEALFPFSPDYVAIHDAARPMISKNLLQNAFKVAAEQYSAVPIVPIQDSLWNYQENILKERVDRDKFCTTQTPQAFSYSKILEAHQKNAPLLEQFTECGAVFETMFGKTGSFTGEKYNIKLTTPEDLFFLEHLLQKKY